MRLVVIDFVDGHFIGGGLDVRTARGSGTGRRRGSNRFPRFPLFAPILSSTFAWYEKILLVTNVFIAFAGLIYALTLVKQVKEAPQGTPRMQEIAHAVR